ncbi:hypothetical protein VTJ49DRAFT_4848 [Mycothermus thermophilus]|uniref:Uncharacterized protein n=1 Tax=Humicola insolens TaxID=85995 RepID=A0ABR3VKY8_HUMIN
MASSPAVTFSQSPPPPRPSTHSHPPRSTRPSSPGTSALPYRPRSDNTQPSAAPRTSQTAPPNSNSAAWGHPPALTPASPRPISEVGVNHYPGTTGPVKTNTGPGIDNKFPPQHHPQQQQYQPYYQYPYHYQQPPPAPAPLTTALIQTIPANAPLSSTRAAAQAALRELLSLRRQRAMLLSVQAQTQPNGVDPLGLGSGSGSGGGGGGGKAGHGSHERGNLQALRDVEERLSAQHRAVVQGLRQLQGRVAEVARRAEGTRWRRFVVGGIM